MVYVFTGDGKGKTTAALGLALRAAGYGKKTLFLQFMKIKPSGEILAAHCFSGLIDFAQFGREEFYIPGPLPDSLKESAGEHFKYSSDPAPFMEDANQGLEKGIKALSEGIYDIVVFDEALNLLRLDLISEDTLPGIIKRFSKGPAEIVFTGRGATDRIIEAADVVTEMKMIKHCYNKGIGARKGIDF
ncbi:MAG: cob(I)yrinic acid a,c-diamide adenosyltransferase [Spirochaetia bacterium]|jgi:cob(I)alamin adenosyltransferase|nr:cob(I)yrinic acid a,c-diamide adenosyltransferase [Spirochaetia bacterium]